MLHPSTDSQDVPPSRTIHQTLNQAWLAKGRTINRLPLTPTPPIPVSVSPTAPAQQPHRSLHRATYAVDAPSVGAGELLLGAGAGRLGAVGVQPVLVGAVDTVRVAVAHPAAGDAQRPAPLLVLRAGELLLGASAGWLSLLC